MKQEVKVSFYTKRNETREDGTCPVMARLTVGVTEAVFSAKLTVPAGMWTSGRAKGKSQTANEINRRLDEIRASALSHWRELSATREKVTAEEVKMYIPLKLTLCTGVVDPFAFLIKNRTKKASLSLCFCFVFELFFSLCFWCFPLPFSEREP